MLRPAEAEATSRWTFNLLQRLSLWRSYKYFLIHNYFLQMLVRFNKQWHLIFPVRGKHWSLNDRWLLFNFVRRDRQLEFERPDEGKQQGLHSTIIVRVSADAVVLAHTQ